MGGWHNICSCTTSLPRLSKAVDYAAMLFFSNGQNGSERHSVFGSVFTDVTTNYQGDLFIHIFREQLFREYYFLCCESRFFTKNPTASQCSWVCFWSLTRCSLGSSLEMSESSLSQSNTSSAVVIFFQHQCLQQLEPQNLSFHFESCATAQHMSFIFNELFLVYPLATFADYFVSVNPLHSSDFDFNFQVCQSLQQQNANHATFASVPKQNQRCLEVHSTKDNHPVHKRPMPQNTTRWNTMKNKTWQCRHTRNNP